MQATKVSRREILRGAAVLVTGAAIGYSRYIEPNFLRRSQYVVPVSGIAREQTVRIMHIADLHHGNTTPISFIEEAFSLGLRSNPDMVVVTGDLIDRDLVRHAELRSCLSDVVRYKPTFVTMGNHDGGLWAKKYGGYDDSSRVRELVYDAGAQLLHNECRGFDCAGVPLNIVGLGDSWADEFDKKAAFEKVSENTTTIVLSHNPDTKDEVGDESWDVMLSGHTHGGQLRIPFDGGTPFAPVRDKRYVAGLNRWQDRWIHTTQGVATTANYRFNCRPEVTILDLIAASRSKA